jgi:hypothetical protein
MNETWKDYEEFVRNLQQAILNSEKFAKHKNIKVEKNKIIMDKNGIDREFDIYWEYELGSLLYKTVIECKDYNSKIKINKIDELLGKLHDIPDIKPVFATKKGYESGARKKAKQHNIELLIVREQNDSDWSDEYGNPYLTSININGILIIPARIISFQPLYDGKWIKVHRPDIDLTRPIQFVGINNEIFIDEVCNNKKYSLYDLAQDLTTSENNEPGEYEKEMQFSEAYILHGKDIFKMVSYKVRYIIIEPIKSNTIVYISQELIGVVEYINKGIKLKIFSNGTIHKELFSIKHI